MLRLFVGAALRGRPNLARDQGAATEGRPYKIRTPRLVNSLNFATFLVSLLSVPRHSLPSKRHAIYDLPPVRTLLF